MEKNTEIAIKFCFELGKSTTETFRMSDGACLWRRLGRVPCYCISTAQSVFVGLIRRPTEKWKTTKTNKQIADITAVLNKHLTTGCGLVEVLTIIPKTVVQSKRYWKKKILRALYFFGANTDSNALLARKIRLKR